ncbi:FtsB family cell division protein [Rubrivirga sp.]|uniref:FtsB family cell division protein n=1 Tax=Rubrivirga sp. TaxID=1885344 RepID=UPI003C75B5F5
MTKRIRRRALTVGIVGLALWVAFFDSHSIFRRVSYARDLDRLTVENAELEARNESLAAQVDRGLDAETLERVAREEYGMRRPGEKVYRIESSGAGE